MGELTDYEKTRYDRQMLFDGWREEGQARLKVERQSSCPECGGLKSVKQ
jgi:hypothetical protein